MNEELVISKNTVSILVFKEPEILIYSNDKVGDVLDNNDTISIVLSKFLIN